MITLDTLRLALLSSDPHGDMDRLVRAELAAGRRTREIYEGLLELVVPVRQSPGYVDESEEALMNTLDALSGFVHPSSTYQDTSGPMAASPANGTVGEPRKEPTRREGAVDPPAGANG